MNSEKPKKGEKSPWEVGPWKKGPPETEFLKDSGKLVGLLEKEMATRSSVLAWRIPGIGEPGGLPSVLAWRIPGIGEPGGLPSIGSHRVRHH